MGDMKDPAMVTDRVYVKFEFHSLIFVIDCISGAAWRSSGPKARPKKPTKPTNAARSGIENDMLDLAEGMKGAASKFQKTIQKDNARLDEIATSQQTNLDSVNSANEQGKQMLRSGNLSFF